MIFSLTKKALLDKLTFLGYYRCVCPLCSMRKEVILAIIIGFGLGLVITFGIWTANKAIKETAPTKEAPLEEAEPTATPAPEVSLTVLSPQNNTVYDEETLTVSGQSAKEAIIVIIYEEGEKILEADENGNFETEIDLIGGENLVEIAAYDLEGNEVSQTFTVVYSTAEI